MFETEPTQEQAFDREFDARMEQSKQEKLNDLLDDPFTAEKLSDLIEMHYGRRFAMNDVKIWFGWYCDLNLGSHDIDPYEFVVALNLDDL